MTDPVEKIAAAVLYEGYVLWPYRRSAQKNQRRWTFGGVYPRAYSEAEGGNDPWLMQTAVPGGRGKPRRRSEGPVLARCREEGWEVRRNRRSGRRGRV